MKKRQSNKALDFDIKWGLKGLKISLYCILAILVILLIILVTKQHSLSAIINILTQKPCGPDFPAILAGIIIFIAIPFLIGIRIGLGIKTKKK